MNKFIDKRYAKSKYYNSVLEEIESARVCPFCKEHFKWHKKPILKRRGGWLVTTSMQPYKNSAYHFIIIGQQHKEMFDDLTKIDWGHITYLVKYVIAKFCLRGGGFVMRFGDTTYTGATVCHLHAHIIVPKLSKGKARTVWFPIG